MHQSHTQIHGMIEMYINISEIFNSIQGEGKYTGYPTKFIRLSSCNRNCTYCDTTYHNHDIIKMTTHCISQLIEKDNVSIICFTGGEPLLQKHAVFNIIFNNKHNTKKFHIETNGDIILSKNEINLFQHINVSPKDINIAKKWYNIKIRYKSQHIYDIIDIKIVTDLKKIGVDMLQYADIIMPLTVDDKKLQLQINQRVWKYCVDNNIRYSTRLHNDVWPNLNKGV